MVRDLVREGARRAPFISPVMPRSGKPMSVRQTNFGALGWTANKGGYAYVATHPSSGAAWPAIPAPLLELWHRLALYSAPPDCCLVNYYGEGARMGLHQDKDEAALDFIKLCLEDKEQRPSAEALLAHGGCDVNHKTKNGGTAFGNACGGGNSVQENKTKIQRLLLHPYSLPTYPLPTPDPLRLQWGRGVQSLL